jgi:hypothetical protein
MDITVVRFALLAAEDMTDTSSLVLAATVVGSDEVVPANPTACAAASLNLSLSATPSFCAASAEISRTSSTTGVRCFWVNACWTVERFERLREKLSASEAATRMLFRCFGRPVAGSVWLLTEGAAMENSE